MEEKEKKYWNTIIIGGGQAGLAAGYYLKTMGEDFIIMDAGKRIGDSWRHRWESLRLFTPNWANSMPGMAFPGRDKDHAGKDEMADYLEKYAQFHNLPVMTECRVHELRNIADGYHVTSSQGTFFCNKVVIANGGYARPKVPGFASEIMPAIKQVHSSQYQRPNQLPAGNILVAGAGTSGMQIAIDLAASGRNVFLAGKPPARIPDFILDRLGKPFVWAANNILTIRTIPGRKAAQQMKMRAPGAPLIHIGMKDVLKAGVTPVTRVAGAGNGYPVLADGKEIDVNAIVWCTGYHIDLSWVNMEDITDGFGHPYAHRGVSKTHKGLYFIGMPFQYALTSTWINGVGRDARYIAEHIHRFYN